MNEKDVARKLEDIELERTYDSIITGGMFAIMVVVLLIQYLQALPGARAEATAVKYPTEAENVGLVWIQMTPAGEPNQVRIISENSTGAFEEVLLGLTT